MNTAKYVRGYELVVSELPDMLRRWNALDVDERRSYKDELRRLLLRHRGAVAAAKAVRDAAALARIAKADSVVRASEDEIFRCIGFRAPIDAGGSLSVETPFPDSAVSAPSPEYQAAECQFL